EGAQERPGVRIACRGDRAPKAGSRVRRREENLRERQAEERRGQRRGETSVREGHVEHGPLGLLRRTTMRKISLLVAAACAFGAAPFAGRLGLVGGSIVLVVLGVALALAASQAADAIAVGSGALGALA